MKFDGIAKLQHLLQTVAFCLAVATIQYAFTPERPYAPQVAYSLAIGTIIWAVVDLGRHLFPSSRETGWPPGIRGLLLVVGGIVAGYLLGTTIADQLCRTFGWYAGGGPVNRSAELRTSILITAMAGIAGTYYFYSVNKSRYLERKMGEAQRHATDARLKLLETQLEPHMLFNTLANLRALIGADPARAQQMLDHMIAYLRATLNASRSTSHTLEDEFDRLRDYLELMAIRMGPRLAFTLDLPPGLARQPVPALLLQPLVENAIKHGLEPQVAGGSVTVSARREAGDVVLDVIDTGLGPGEAAGSKGFGLAQVRERLAALYGPAGAIEFVAAGDRGTRATVRFPSQT
jgi:hypothetical protein